ncbi:MAG TPA: TetR/AcrR family transcriptional regulator [Acidimicrobiales bacterium]|nr:TetR/AcrR family transcriptional regulator [Acidimicrobiales bacterium]
MARSSASAVVPEAGPSRATAGAARRELLLDIAAQILAGGHADEVTMETVAARAGVSRALVYKHFANRQELLGALYERESRLLHRQLSAAVEQCDSLEGMLRALVEGALAAQATRSATFVALAAEGGRPAGQRDRQRRRDERTLRYFTDRAVDELGIGRRLAEPAIAMALGGIGSVLATWRRRPTEENARSLSELYVMMVMGGLRALPTSPGTHK